MAREHDDPEDYPTRPHVPAGSRERPAGEQPAGEQPVGKGDLHERAASLALTHAAHTHAFLQLPDRSIRRTELARPARRKRGKAGQPDAAGQRDKRDQRDERDSVRPDAKHPASVRPEPGLQPLVMGHTLGAGGMGIVHAADQVSLGRQVAVKTLKEDFQGEHATLMLLQEAFVMGRIEHPNILPIHDLQYDEGGNPRLVLKRIEGVEWRTLMADAKQVREQFAEEDLLAWNLRVLIQVCDATHFAHSRGIIHRDLKPSNVMIGRFGEVYVMDWGLALSLEEDEEGLLPLVQDAKQLAGTPQYMAPEMLGGEEVQLGACTDVYLLGAVLYEVVTDLPPHDGKTMEALIAAVLRSRPSFPPGAPGELVDICRRAMHPDPRHRFESALELRRALQSFLEHAGSRRVEAQARELATELSAMIAADPRPPSAQLQERFAQCRFAYLQALELWSDNPHASGGLHAATVMMARHELGEGNARTAEQLLTSLTRAEPGLAEAIQKALSEQAEAQRRMQDLERFQREASIETGSRSRAIVAGLLGLSWTVAPLLGLFMAGNIERPVQRVLPSLFGLGVLAALVIVGLLGREEIRKSRLTQYLLGGAVVAMVALCVTELSGYVLGLEMEVVQSLWPLTWFSISAMLTMTVDRRMLPMTLGFLGGLAIAVQWPAHRFYGMAASNLVMTINMFTIWLRPREEGELSMIERLRAMLAKRGA